MKLKVYYFSTLRNVYYNVFSFVLTSYFAVVTFNNKYYYFCFHLECSRQGSFRSKLPANVRLDPSGLSRLSSTTADAMIERSATLSQVCIGDAVKHLIYTFLQDHVECLNLYMY